MPERKIQLLEELEALVTLGNSSDTIIIDLKEIYSHTPHVIVDFQTVFTKLTQILTSVNIQHEVKLELRNSQLDQRAAEKIAELLKSKNCPQGLQLNLVSNYIFPTCLPILKEALKNNYTCTNLALELSDADIFQYIKRNQVIMSALRAMELFGEDPLSSIKSDSLQFIAKELSKQIVLLKEQELFSPGNKQKNNNDSEIQHMANMVASEVLLLKNQQPLSLDEYGLAQKNRLFNNLAYLIHHRDNPNFYRNEMLNMLSLSVSNQKHQQNANPALPLLKMLETQRLLKAFAHIANGESKDAIKILLIEFQEPDLQRIASKVLAITHLYERQRLLKGLTLMANNESEEAFEVILAPFYDAELQQASDAALMQLRSIEKLRLREGLANLLRGKDQRALEILFAPFKDQELQSIADQALAILQLTEIKRLLKGLVHIGNDENQKAFDTLLKPFDNPKLQCIANIAIAKLLYFSDEINHSLTKSQLHEIKSVYQARINKAIVESSAELKNNRFNNQHGDNYLFSKMSENINIDTFFSMKAMNKLSLSNDGLTLVVPENPFKL